MITAPIARKSSPVPQEPDKTVSTFYNFLMNNGPPVYTPFFIAGYAL